MKLSIKPVLRPWFSLVRNGFTQVCVLHSCRPPVVSAFLLRKAGPRDASPLVQLVAELRDAEGLGELEDSVAERTGALLECGRESIGAGDEAGLLGPRQQP